MNNTIREKPFRKNSNIVVCYLSRSFIKRNLHKIFSADEFEFLFGQGKNILSKTAKRMTFYYGKKRGKDE